MSIAVAEVKAKPRLVIKDPVSESKRWLLLTLVLAVSYGLVLANFPIDVFKDRDNYLNYVLNSDIILGINASAGLLTLFANEPLWLLLNTLMKQIFEPEQAIRFYIFMSATTFSFLFLRKDPGNIVWLVLFLFGPQIVKNYIIHLRQGVAISIFFIGWTLVGSKKHWMVMMLTPFIHASFFFVLVFLVLDKFTTRFRLSGVLRISVFFIAGLLFTLSVGYLAAAVGARQANEYGFSAEGISGLGFIFWLSILFIFILQGASFIKRYSFEVSVLIFYLCAYFFIEVSGRVFESTLFLVLLAGLTMNGWRKPAFLSLILFYSVFSYILRLGQPWLGFGV